MSSKSQGFSLLEIMLTLSIAAILMTLALPRLESWQERIEARHDLMQIQMFLHYSREQALFHRQHVTLCPLDASLRCTSHWNQALSLFLDPNYQRQLSSPTQLLKVFPELNSTYRSRRFNNHSVGFDGRGFAGYANGSFIYCLKKRQQKLVAFVISRNGRIRTNANPKVVCPDFASG